MLVFPNYKKSIVNAAASIKKYYRIPTNVPTIASLDSALDSIYKNVVFIVLCGVGENMLRDALGFRSMLVKKMTDQITSVCPACPANTDVSLLSGTYPNEHGRLGQTLFFKEFCRSVELSTNLDPYSGQSVSMTNAADFILPFENFFGDIADSIIGGVQPFSISAPGSKITENKSYHKTADNPKRMFELIKKIAETDQNTFTYVKWTAPRDAAAAYGCRSSEVKDILNDINDTIEGLSRSLTDTVFIVTSDHGMTDISSDIMLNLKYDLFDCLIMPPSFCKRAVNFFVKADRRSDFERIFISELGNDFLLMSRNDIIAKQLFGGGRTNPKVMDFLGDYIAFGIGDKAISFRALSEKHRPADKASYGGITTDEMCLPLTVITTKQTDKWKRPFYENIAPVSFDKEC